MSRRPRRFAWQVTWLVAVPKDRPRRDGRNRVRFLENFTDLQDAVQLLCEHTDSGLRPRMRPVPSLLAPTMIKPFKTDRFTWTVSWYVEIPEDELHWSRPPRRLRTREFGDLKGAILHVFQMADRGFSPYLEATRYGISPSPQAARIDDTASRDRTANGIDAFEERTAQRRKPETPTGECIAPRNEAS